MPLLLLLVCGLAECAQRLVGWRAAALSLSKAGYWTARPCMSAETPQHHPWMAWPA